MTLKQNIVVHFKEVPTNNGVRQFIEDRCMAMTEEFPETTKYEISLSRDGDGYTAHAHVTGKKIDVAATHDWEKELGHAADQVLGKLHTQLRKKHDKTISNQRRKAQRASRDHLN